MHLKVFLNQLTAKGEIFLTVTPLRVLFKTYSERLVREVVNPFHVPPSASPIPPISRDDPTAALQTDWATTARDGKCGTGERLWAQEEMLASPQSVIATRVRYSIQWMLRLCVIFLPRRTPLTWERTSWRIAEWSRCVCADWLAGWLRLRLPGCFPLPDFIENRFLGGLGECRRLHLTRTENNGLL